MRRIQLSLGIACLFLMYLTPVLGQVSNCDINEFPPHIIYRMQTIDNIIRLSKQSLQNLGLYFIRQDSLAANILHDNGFHASLTEFYQTPVDELRGIISDLEFNDYKIIIRSNRSSRLREIVYCKDKINLKPSEVRGLLLCSDRIERRIGQKGFRQREMEFRWADSIMGQERLRLFYRTKYEDKIHKTVAEWYNGMKKEHWINVREDSVSICASLLRFESERFSYSEYWKNAGTASLYKEAMATDLFKKPESLKQWETYKKLPSWSLIRDVLYSKELIALTTAQVDSLFGIPERLEQLKEEKKRQKEKYLQRGLEYSLVKEVLTPVQINVVLKEKYGNEMRQSVEKDLETLEKNGLLQGRDAGIISKELLDYKLNLEIANVLVELEKSREHVFKRYDLENNKPVLIRKLEEIRKLEKEKKKVQF